EAGLKVDPVIVKAVQPLKDGEIGAAPVPEGEYFAVIWRRGTVPARRHALEEVAAQIRDTIWEEKTEQAAKKLLDEVHAPEVKELNPALIDTIEISAAAGAIAPRKRPGQVPPLRSVPTQK